MFTASKITSIFKIYTKILFSVCIFWMIGAGCFYFISFCHTFRYVAIFLDQSIPQYMRYFLYSKESLYQTSWLPIMLFPCAIFLFHWMRGKLKERLPEEIEKVKVTETKITDDELDPDQVDINKLEDI